MVTKEEDVLTLLKSYLDDIGEDPSAALPGAKLEEIGIDSLMAVDLVFKLEEHFGVELDPNEFRDATVAEAVALVVRKLPPFVSTAVA
jgi:acyl carrier protein